MKTLTHIYLPIFILILIVLSGCATTEPTQSEQTRNSIEAVEEQLENISEQLDKISSSLQDVTNADKSELEDTYDSFSSNVERIVEMKNEFSNLSEELRINSNQFLAEWQKEGETYDSGQLRSASADRREKLNQTFNEVMDNSGEVNRTLGRYISQVEEIQSYLSNDLTTEGAEGVDPLRRKVETSGDDVRNAIYRMQRSITDTKEEMGIDTTSN
jgi:methyl-accepting chemotaxis protein